MLKVSYTYVDMLINLYTLLPTDYIYLNVDIPIVFLKKWAIHGLFFFIFVFPIQLIILKWLDSNHRSLVSEATALPTEPQPLPMTCLFQTVVYVTNFSSIKHRIVSSIVLSVK